MLLFSLRPLQTGLLAVALSTATVFQPTTASPGAPFPQVEVEDSNPYWQRLLLEFERLDNELASGKKPETEFKNALHIRDSFRDIDFLVWAYYAEQSPLQGEPKLREHLFRQMEILVNLADGSSYVSNDTPPDHNMDRFILAKLGQAWLWWKAADPEASQTQLGKKILQLLHNGAELQIARYGKPGDQPYGPTWYPNIDATWVVQMWTAAQAVNKPEWKELANKRLDSLEKSIYPAGGWPYLAYTNAEPAYQGVAVRQIARYYLLSGDPRIERIAKSLAPYYPLATERGGVSEGSTSPHWKHRWDAIKPNEPDLIASIANDPANAALAATLYDNYLSPRVHWHRSDLLLSALLYKDIDTTGVIAFADQLVFDANVEGPRGRFGNWSFVASGRNWKDDRGKMSYVGLMQLVEEDIAYPLSGAVQTAGFRIRSKNKSYELAMDEDSEWIIAGDWASFTSYYKFQQPISGGGRSYPVPWAGSQQWLLTPRRAVGLLQVWQDGAITADTIEGMLRIGNGRGLPLKNRPKGKLVALGNNQWSYGDLIIRLHAMSFDKVSTQHDTAYRGTPVAMLLGNTNTNTPAPTHEAPFYYLIEVHGKGIPPAQNVFCELSARAATILGVEDEGRRWTLYSNPTDRTIRVDLADRQGDLFIGERLPHLSQPRPLSSGSQPLTSRKHIVIVK